MRTAKPARALSVLATALLLALSVPAGHAAVPQTLNYQGFLTDAAGLPLAGSQPVTFKLYSVLSGGSPLYTETQTVTVDRGIFNAQIGAITPLALDFDVPYWLEVSIGTTVLSPRQALASGAYALRAKIADTATTATTATALAANGSNCAAGQYPLGVDAQGNAEGCTAAGTGTVTSVAAGAGLSGGTITGSGTLSLMSCSSGQLLKHNGSTWACAADTATSATTATALAANGSNCPAGQYPLGVDAQGNAEGCTTAGTGTVTSVAAGAGLTGGTITGSGTLAIDPTSSTLTGNFFKQGGNAFGATAVLGTTENQALDIRVYGSRVMRYVPTSSGSHNVVGGYSGNVVDASGTAQTIAGGGAAGSTCYNPGTGLYNYSCRNATASFWSTVSGGQGNNATASSATVSGGNSNSATGAFSVVAGGEQNVAEGIGSTVSGGYTNRANGWYSTVPGGDYNYAGGDYSFAAGHKANALHVGSFVWADSGSTSAFQSTHDNQFSIRATGGIQFFTSADLSAGVFVPIGGSGWESVSDRNAKRDFIPVDGKAVLAKLMAMPLNEWSYKTEASGARHIGPVAQDFHATFGLGESDKTINSLDADGVALAAIQGIARIVQEKDGELAALRTDNEALKARLAALEASQRDELAALRRSIAELQASLARSLESAVPGPLAQRSPR